MNELLIDMVSHLNELTGLHVSVNYSDQDGDCIVLNAITRPKETPPLSLDKSYMLENTTLSIYISADRFEVGSKVAKKIIDELDNKRMSLGNTVIHLSQLLHSTSIFEQEEKQHVFSIDLDITHSNRGLSI